tara:strand:+ start:2752 stop:2946 length:195 start_codon:yes stop_codon:yes gene_type:complete
MTKTKNNLGSVPFLSSSSSSSSVRVYTRREMMWRKEKAIDDPRFFLDIFSLFWREKWNFLNEKG